MIQTVEGEIYYISANEIDDIYSFGKDFYYEPEHKNDILAISDLYDEIVFVSKSDIEYKTIDKDNYVPFSHNVFKRARENSHLIKGGVVPVINENKEPIFLLKAQNNKGYIHQYETITEKADSRVFELYDAIVLMDVTEYGFILLNDALRDFEGRIVCAGRDWPEFACLFSGRDNILFIDDKLNIPKELLKKHTMYLIEFSSLMAGYKERCKEGFFSYDEIMTLVYFFSIRKSFGGMNADKKYYLINPVFQIEGLMSICDKCELPFSYVLANGYIPVIRLTKSSHSIYSDFNGEDIWNKFFNQPYGAEANEWEQSANVWDFPNAVITFPARWLMKQIMDFQNTGLVNIKYINDKVKEEVEKEKKELLVNPQKTIGVLIRGTDYTVSHIAGHSVMATPEQVKTKIDELLELGEFEKVYLATEDEKVLEQMENYYGDLLLFTNQKRFQINTGELLADQERTREKEGWLKGKEYLVTLSLLAECGAFIASGACCGTTCASNSGKEKYKYEYIFNLGRY